MAGILDKTRALVKSFSKENSENNLLWLNFSNSLQVGTYLTYNLYDMDVMDL